MKNKEKIDVMLKEYETLRLEIMQKLSQQFAFLSLTGALGFYAFFISKTFSLFQFFIIIIAFIILIFSWYVICDTLIKCHNRLVEIENKINRLASEILLKHENNIESHFFIKMCKKKLF